MRKSGSPRTDPGENVTYADFKAQRELATTTFPNRGSSADFSIGEGNDVYRAQVFKDGIWFEKQFAPSSTEQAKETLTAGPLRMTLLLTASAIVAYLISPASPIPSADFWGIYALAAIPIVGLAGFAVRAWSSGIAERE